VAVGVGDEGPGQAEHARITSERAAGELGQLPVVARRQVVADLADLRFDQAVVIEQPFGGGDDTAPAFQLRRAGAIRRKQDSGVFIEAALQRQDGPRLGRDRLGRRQGLGVLLQPLDTEQLLPDGGGVVPWRRRRMAAERPGSQLGS
jgi:hypothetical protein